MPVRMFRIWRGIPKMTAHNNSNIRHKIRSAVDRVCNQSLRIANNAHNKLGNRERGVPAKPNPSHFANFCTVIFFAYASHDL